MAIKFQILFTTETTDNYVFHHASQVPSSFGGPMLYVFA